MFMLYFMDNRVRTSGDGIFIIYLYANSASLYCALRQSVLLRRCSLLYYLTRYLMRIVATDSTGKTGQAQLTVNLNRNLHPPVIQPPLTRRVNISDTLSPGATITTIRATGMCRLVIFLSSLFSVTQPKLFSGCQ